MAVHREQRGRRGITTTCVTSIPDYSCRPVCKVSPLGDSVADPVARLLGSGRGTDPGGECTGSQLCWDMQRRVESHWPDPQPPCPSALRKAPLLILPSKLISGSPHGGSTTLPALRPQAQGGRPGASRRGESTGVCRDSMAGTTLEASCSPEKGSMGQHFAPWPAASQLVPIKWAHIPQETVQRKVGSD